MHSEPEGLNMIMGDHMDHRRNFSSITHLGCDERWEYRNLHRVVLSLVSSILILVGSTGNTIAFCVLKQKAYKNNVMASALRYLAVIDILVLWTVVSRLFLKGAFDTDIFIESSKLCV
ncbi:hypothetical protein PoB_001224600 [Plakobranchus ocellatus]|uniref:G-protein coupled receptors family 1 profile domain-containing protein n=1 Tax=Plakobranchus ocellatus TaxID=259542 RepID=A0AAV3YQZ1_9GAST|nr:hypothetical protein PoB_001224600 [Plakobranchus ocellatus]